MRSPVPIYDCHGHLGLHPDFPSYKHDAGEMIRVMDVLNIEVLAISSMRACYNDCPRGNAEVAEVLKKYPNRFRGYITVNPHLAGEAHRELERWNGFHRPPLIKLHPGLHQYPVNGSAYRPIWDYASQTRAVVLVHTWDSDPNCGPLLLGPIAREFARARMIIGHSGVTQRGYQQAMDVAESAPNTFLDISGSQSHRTILEVVVSRLGAGRILFGSDMPYLEAATSLGRVLTARISDQDKESILRTNFRGLLEED
jgi:predicted TIM-barrel fold metal-dependent hydrolase